MRTQVVWLACLLLSGHMTIARAQESGDTDFKRRGDAFLTERKYVEALEAYDKAYALSPNPAIDYNRGRALQFLARYPEALDAFERFWREATDDLKARVPGVQGVLVELRRKVARVAITCDVPAARILLGGKAVGQAPLDKPIRVNAGKTSVEILADGYFPFRRDVELRGNDAENRVEARLASRSTSSVLLVRSTVQQSDVFVDGSRIGQVPAEAVLAAGMHPVRVVHDGYLDATTQVVLRAGEQKELTLDPEKAPPFTARWWFWTALGVIIVGGGVTTIAILLTTERGPPVGDFTPGRLGL